MFIKIKNYLGQFSFFKNLFSSINYTFPRFSLKKFTKPSFFYNNSKNNDTCCIILAGYKEFLWESVFDRIKMFEPENIDICIASSGLYSEKLHTICKENDWSYMSIKRNSIPLTLNTAIKQFPNAKKIFKIDEDIFITKNFFSKMDECLNLSKNSDYFPSFVAPLIPINGYSHLEVLKKISLESEYEKRFETPKYAASDDRLIQNDPEVAKFFWGDTGHVPPIDVMDENFSKDPLSFSVCPIRFSIGAILFDRSIWEKMGYFSVSIWGNGLGSDEVQICSLSMESSNAIIVCNNTLVGHLSFKHQNDAMKKYFLDNPNIFSIINKK